MDQKPERTLLFALVLLTIFRIIIGAASELSEDEAYYFLWTERLDWSYYSKGPGVALAIAATTELFGKTSLGVRILSPLLGLASSWLLFRLGTRLVGQNHAIWAVVMLNLTPIFNAGSILLTIDPLMIFFWVAAMLTTWHAVQTTRRSLLWWILTGFLIGLGFLCKYTAAVQIISIVIYLAARSETKIEFRRPGFYAMLGAVVLCSTPVLIWNSQNDWITFVHLIERTGLVDFNSANDATTAITEDQSSGFSWNPFDIFNYLGQHLGVYSPLLFLALAWTTVQAWKRFRASEAETFIGSFGLPIVVFYFGLSVLKMGELNWTAPGFVCLGLLLPKYWSEANLSALLKRRLTITAFAISGILTVLAVNPEIIRSTGLTWPYSYDTKKRWSGWKTSAEQIADFAAQLKTEMGEAPFLIGNRYQTCAAIAFYFPDESLVMRPTPRHPLVHTIEPRQKAARKNQFAFWPAYQKDERFLGRNAIFVTDQIKSEGPPTDVREAFADFEVYGWIDLNRRGELLRSWKVIVCYDYQGLKEE